MCSTVFNGDSAMTFQATCPDCCSVLPKWVDECPICEQPLDWIDRVPHFQRSLEQAAQGKHAVLVRLSWSGRHRFITLEASGTVGLKIDDLRRVEITLAEDLNSVTCTHSDRVVEVPVGGSAQLDEFHLRVSRSLDVPAGQPAEPSKSFERNLGRFDEREFALWPDGDEVKGGGDPRTLPEHCVVVALHSLPTAPGDGDAPKRYEYWIVDNGVDGGLFINRKPARVRRLESGDFIQFGEFGCVFNDQEGYLVSAWPIAREDRVGIELRGVSLTIRERKRKRKLLSEVDLEISAGEFVAITGPSGCGKSTLLKSMAGIPGSRDTGQVIVNGCDIERDAASFRGVLSYLSQESSVHDDLTARQALQFNGRFRSGKPVEQKSIETRLRQVDLGQDCWEKSQRVLSGGEEKRVRIASELISNPRLFLLDEPASGLDSKRELALMKLLRNLAYTGCTIVVVTHGQFAHLCDREVRLKAKGGKIDTIRDRSDRPVEPEVDPEESDALNQPRNSARSPAVPSPKGRSLRQFFLLLKREWTLTWNCYPSRLVFPLFLVPIVFAVALEVSVKIDDRKMLGFLSVLSVIWMGTSLGLMKINGEREVFDHERLLFLKLIPYVFSKLLFYVSLATGQVVVFVSLLWLFRAEKMLYQPLQVGIDLALVACAAVMMGLLISSLVGRNKDLANIVLPLVMIAQIVFSVVVAGNATYDIGKAYGEFSHGPCQGLCSLSECSEEKRFRPRKWVWIDDKQWFFLCHDRGCREFVESRESTEKKWTAEKINTNIGGRERDLGEKKLANPWAINGSYFTLSRWGDMVLRSYAFFEFPDSTDNKRIAPIYGREGRTALACVLVGLVLFTLIVLRVQNSVFFARRLRGHR